ncbi:MAG: DNA mismatch repair protein MutS [Clostridiales bacterium]|jgi:DNA mismatch repair protein MutS|nr:DNA mismatch repair protein MutS [Clostridiales bacterium]
MLKDIDKTKLSPMMQQYCEIKERYANCLLFFRLGDFYEMFFDDALEAAGFLNITLTSRDCGQSERAPMCGVPFHAAQSYIDRLIKGGYRVAICEQTEDPSLAKDLVKREVIRVITAGTVTSDECLEAKGNNYLCCLHSIGDVSGLAAVDITTGKLSCTEIRSSNPAAGLLNELARYNPREIVLCKTSPHSDDFAKTLTLRFNSIITTVNEEAFDPLIAKMLISKQFGENAPDMSDILTGVIGSLLNYLSGTQMCNLPHINAINFYSSEKYMQIDYASKHNLEITETIREGKRKGSLLGIIDKTCTSMGGRLLRNWLDKPLVDVKEIEERHNAVNVFFQSPILCDELRALLARITDIERLTSRVVTHSANPRDLISLSASLELIPQIHKLIHPIDNPLVENMRNNFDELADIHTLISRAIADDPPISTREGNIIREGYDENIDKYRSAMNKGTDWLSSLELKERERTGIKNLKVSFNRVAGYYIEVSKSNISKVPKDYIRKATLVNSERFITGELKEIENTILGATERNCQLEHQIFCEIIDKVSFSNARILNMAEIIATLDVLAALAKVAQTSGFVMPTMTTDNIISIKNGRHPVVEANLSNAEFIENDTFLDGTERVAIITGPNMAGKSTYMRQAALITLLAQIGSFVPASSAKIGITDKIFTRVGASDDLAAGQSTFMVEMTEVSNILKNATDKSLIILDEIGRGTSTYDGLAIAWAVVEHIADTNKIGAKTLFATHYHELTELEGKVDGVRNYCVAAEKRADGIVFLRKVVPGGADDSYGIEVAKLAGVCDDVVQRAHEIVSKLEGKEEDKLAV